MPNFHEYRGNHALNKNEIPKKHGILKDENQIKI